MGVRDLARLIAAALELYTALAYLSNEVIGSLGVEPEAIRRAIGNTNFVCLERRAHEARALLAENRRRCVMGKVSRRNLRVIDGGKRRLPAGPPVRLRRVMLNVPTDVWTDTELRQSLVAEQYPSSGDFLLALIRAGIDAFDRELQAEKDRRDSAHSQQEQMRSRRPEPGSAADCPVAAPPVAYAPYETHVDEGGEG